MRFTKTPGELVAEVSMERADSFDGCLLVVESLDDKKFWVPFVDSHTCRILLSYGKSCALAAVELLERTGRLRRVLAVVDDDLDLLFGRRSFSDAVVYTDAHDIEAVLIRSDATTRVVPEYADAQALAELQMALGVPIVRALVARALLLGRVRMRAQRDAWAVSFDGVTCFRLVSLATWEFDETALIGFVRDQAPELDANVLVEVMHREEDCDPWYVCHGQDLLQLLCVLLTGRLRAKHVGPATLQSALRLAFTEDDLRATEMYTNIRLWEARSSISILGTASH